MYFTTTSDQLRTNSYAPVSKLARRLRHPYEGCTPKPRRKDQTMKISQAGTDVHAVLDKLAAAHAAHDADGLFALYSDDMVAYSLAPPLAQGPETPYGTVDGIRAWFAGFAGPVQLTFHNPVVSQDGDLAFVHTLTNMATTQAGQPEPISFSFWYRSTFGLRRTDGSWLITHRHDSTPFYMDGMDGSFRAATDLEP
jgi:ketosteroid isomerase-like protein